MGLEEVLVLEVDSIFSDEDGREKYLTNEGISNLKRIKSLKL
jgi:hypothetical protein